MYLFICRHVMKARPSHMVEDSEVVSPTVEWVGEERLPTTTGTMKKAGTNHLHITFHHIVFSQATE